MRIEEFGLVKLHSELASHIVPHSTLISAPDEGFKILAEKLDADYLAIDLWEQIQYKDLGRVYRMFVEDYHKFKNPFLFSVAPLESWDDSYSEDSSYERKTMHNLRRLFSKSGIKGVLWSYDLSFDELSQMMSELRRFGISTQRYEIDGNKHLWIPKPV